MIKTKKISFPKKTFGDNNSFIVEDVESVIE
jgi:hypothetical protein